MMKMMGSALPPDVLLKVKEGLLRQRELEINRFSLYFFFWFLLQSLFLYKLYY